MSVERVFVAGAGLMGTGIAQVHAAVGKRVALYEFSEKKEADKKAKELTASGKSPHFVQPVKEVIEE